MRRLRALKMGLIAVPLAVLFLVGIGFVVMSLWNGLAPALFGWKAIGFWQAVGLIILIRLLFGGFRGGACRSGHWRHRVMERFEKMTPEEREKFRQAFNERWGRGAPPDPKPTV